MYRDQFGEIVCGYWGLKGYRKFDDHRINGYLIMVNFEVKGEEMRNDVNNMS